MLRRTKLELIENKTLSDMPVKNIELVPVKLDSEEKAVYQKILIYSKTLFSQYLQQRGENYENEAYSKAHGRLAAMSGQSEVKTFEILVLILRLRQICSHPGLITAMFDNAEANVTLDESMSEHCSSFDLIDQINRLKLIENTDNNETDNHLAKTSAKIIHKSNPVFNFERQSSKIRKIFEILEEKILITDDKAIIVSQWSGVLDIIGNFLVQKSIRFTTLTGKVAVKDRGTIVDRFNDDRGGPKILLLTLTAGGVGLNLVGANHLFLIDLHWNPQLEAQAQDRIYRVGQKKPVFIYKYNYFI